MSIIVKSLNKDLLISKLASCNNLIPFLVKSPPSGCFRLKVFFVCGKLLCLFLKFSGERPRGVFWELFFYPPLYLLYLRMLFAFSPFIPFFCLFFVFRFFPVFHFFPVFRFFLVSFSSFVSSSFLFRLSFLSRLSLSLF